MIKPLRDLLLVRHLAKPGMIGLIHIPDVTKSTKNQTFVQAEVVAAGPAATVPKGATVLVSEYFGDEVKDDGVKYHLGRERDIVGVIA